MQTIHQKSIKLTKWLRRQITDTGSAQVVNSLHGFTNGMKKAL